LQLHLLHVLSRSSLMVNYFLIPTSFLCSTLTYLNILLAWVFFHRSKNFFLKCLSCASFFKWQQWSSTTLWHVLMTTIFFLHHSFYFSCSTIFFLLKVFFNLTHSFYWLFIFFPNHSRSYLNSHECQLFLSCSWFFS
jgi:hypothetical protein